MPTTPRVATTRWVPQAASPLVHVAALAFAASLVIKSESAMSLVLLLLEVEMQELPKDVALDFVEGGGLGYRAVFPEHLCKRPWFHDIFRGYWLV
jgi:hypothetical protein